MCSLEAIVKKHFPLYVDRFNFRLQTIKYVQVSLNTVSATAYITVAYDNLFRYSPKSYVWYSEDAAFKILKKIICNVVFPELQKNPNFKVLLDALLEGYSHKLKVITDKKKKKLDKMCELNYVRFKKEPYTTNYEYRKLVSRNSFSGILGLINHVKSGRVLFNEFGPDSKVRFVVVSEKNRDEIYQYYCNTLVVNDKQRELIQIAIDKAVEYNKLKA